MTAPTWSVNRWLKEVGFRRLLKGGWFQQVILLDEYLNRHWQAELPGAPLFFLPGPCPDVTPGDSAEARRALGVPADRRVFLCFGEGSRRKGLHLAVRAVEELDDPSAFLLCAGRQQADAGMRAGLERLAEQGRARLIDRYVSTAEENLCFEASDVVLLPYVNHFGTSAVLFRAAASARMVIASEGQLLGRLVRDHGLGLLFPQGSATGLTACLRHALALTGPERAGWTARARAFAAKYSRAAYRAALWAALGASAAPGPQRGPP